MLDERGVGTGRGAALIRGAERFGGLYQEEEELAIRKG